MSHLVLHNITKSFTDGSNQSRMVLDGIHLSVEKGEFIAITGVSGSGKSTLLNILGTHLRPDSGTYQLDGKDLTLPGMQLEEVRNRQIGMLFQDFRLLPQFTALQNILLPTLARKSASTQQENDYALHLMQLLGIDRLQHQLPNTLSGGEKARVALCRALIQQPALVLADEPTGQLDAENANNLADVLCRVNRELGTTIIMVTHDLQIAAKAQRTLILQHGKLR